MSIHPEVSKSRSDGRWSGWCVGPCGTGQREQLYSQQFNLEQVSFAAQSAVDTVQQAGTITQIDH